MLNVQTRPWSDLKPHPENPRHGDEEALAESLRSNGQYKPIVTTADGTILAGNHTYAAAGLLGWKEMSCVVLDLDPNSTEALRIMVVDNRASDLGRYDDTQMAGLLDRLQEADGGLIGSGYGTDDVEDLLSLIAYRDRETLGEAFTNYEGASAAATVDGSARTAGYESSIGTYHDRDTRPVILNYSIADYDRVMETLERARDAAQVDNNADAVLAALNAYVGSTVA